MTFFNGLKAAMLLGCVFASADASAERFLYTGGHPADVARAAALGDTFTEFNPNDSGWTTALSGGYGAFDAFVVGEDNGYWSISPSTRSAIANYVNGGGKLIVVGDHGGSTTFLNQIFGYSAVTAYGCGYDQSVAGTKTAAAAGTNFAAGPQQLHNLSCTGQLVTATLPAAAKTMYAGSGTSLVFTAPYGSGQIGYLGWDLCGEADGGCGNETAYEDDWYIVLHAALLPSFTTCAAAGYFGSQLTLCKTICEQRQNPATLSGLLRVYRALYRSTPSCPAAQ